MDYENIYQQVQDIGLNKLEKRLRYCMNFNVDFEYNDIKLNRKHTVGLYAYLVGYYGLNDIKKENNRYYAKLQRVRKRINSIINSNLDAYFLTLTFEDIYFNSYCDIKTHKEYNTAESRHRYVQRFLKENFADYVANIDFGKKGNREHYHAVVCSNNDLPIWNYGFKKYDLINNNNIEAISRYINKLSFHAIKDTTKRSYLIYCRHKK